MADEMKPIEGATTVDEKVVFEAQRLSYDAARIIAEKIARRISERTRGREVVIAGTQLIADFSNLVAIKAVLEKLEYDYDGLAGLARASVQRSLFRTLFTGDGLSSTGGAVVSWAILSAHGAVEDGGIFSESRSAKSPKPPENQSSIA